MQRVPHPVLSSPSSFHDVKPHSDADSRSPTSPAAFGRKAPDSPKQPDTPGQSKRSGLGRSALFSIGLYSLFSSSMLVVNKVTLHFLPFPALVTCFHIFSSCVFIYAGKACGALGRVDALVWAKVKPYLFYVFLFALALLTNMKSLRAANVETVIVFRSMTPLAVSVLDAMYLGRELPAPRSWLALLIIAAGATAYAYCDEEFRGLGWTAYGWPVSYFAIIAVEMTYGKLVVHGVEMESKIWGPTLYTNVLSLPIMVALLLASDDLQRFGAMRAAGEVPKMGLALICVGAVVGTGISYAGWLCRSQTSASTYTLVGVLNKCGTVLANLLIWSHHASPAGIAALLVCLGGGTLYRQAPVREGPPLAVARLGDASTRVFKCACGCLFPSRSGPKGPAAEKLLVEEAPAGESSSV